MDQQEMKDLIEKCKQKDEDAFQELYKQFYPVAFQLAYHIAKSHADASDIAQETLIAVYDHIEGLHSPEYFPLWLKRIVVSKCNRVFRKNKHVSYVGDDDLNMQLSIDHKRDNNPEPQIHFNSDQEVLSFFIRQLPEKQAEVLTLYYFEQLSINEIALKLNIPTGTVKSRMLLAKKHLKKNIAHYEESNQTTLDFNSAALASLLSGGSIFSLSALKRNLLPSLSTTTITVITTGVLITAAVCGGLILNNDKQVNEKQANNDQPILSNISNRDTKTFKIVEVDGMRIDSAQDAYFKILLWTDDFSKLQFADEKEKTEFMSLLNALKDYGGLYYENILKIEDIKKLVEI